MEYFKKGLCIAIVVSFIITIPNLPLSFSQDAMQIAAPAPAEQIPEKSATQPAEAPAINQPAYSPPSADKAISDAFEPGSGVELTAVTAEVKPDVVPPAPSRTLLTEDKDFDASVQTLAQQVSGNPNVNVDDFVTGLVDAISPGLLANPAATKDPAHRSQLIRDGIRFDILKTLADGTRALTQNERDLIPNLFGQAELIPGTQWPTPLIARFESLTRGLDTMLQRNYSLDWQTVDLLKRIADYRGKGMALEPSFASTLGQMANISMDGKVQTTVAVTPTSPDPAQAAAQAVKIPIPASFASADEFSKFFGDMDRALADQVRSQGFDASRMLSGARAAFFRNHPEIVKTILNSGASFARDPNNENNILVTWAQGTPQGILKTALPVNFFDPAVLAGLISPPAALTEKARVAQIAGALNITIPNDFSTAEAWDRFFNGLLVSINEQEKKLGLEPTGLRQVQALAEFFKMHPEIVQNLVNSGAGITPNSRGDQMVIRFPPDNLGEALGRTLPSELNEVIQAQLTPAPVPAPAPATTPFVIGEFPERFGSKAERDQYILDLLAYIRNAYTTGPLPEGYSFDQIVADEFMGYLKVMVNRGLLTQDERDQIAVTQGFLAQRAPAPEVLPPAIPAGFDTAQDFQDYLASVDAFLVATQPGIEGDALDQARIEFFRSDLTPLINLVTSAVSASGTFNLDGTVKEYILSLNEEGTQNISVPLSLVDLVGELIPPEKGEWSPSYLRATAFWAQIAALEEAASAKLKEYEVQFGDLTRPRTAYDYEAVKNLLIQLQNDLTKELDALAKLKAPAGAGVFLMAKPSFYYYESLPIYFQSPGYDALADRARALLMSGYLRWETEKKQVYEAYTPKFDALSADLQSVYSKIDQEMDKEWKALQARLEGKTELTWTEYVELNQFTATWDARYAEATQDYAAKRAKLEAEMNEVVSRISLSPEAQAGYNDAYNIARTRESYQRRDYIELERIMDEESIYGRRMVKMTITAPIERIPVRKWFPQFSSDGLYKVTPVQKKIANAVEALIAAKTVVAVIKGQEVRMNLANLVKVINEEAASAYTLRLPGITGEDLTALGTPLNFDLATGRALALRLVERYGQTVIRDGNVDEEAFRARLQGKGRLAPVPGVPSPAPDTVSLIFALENGIATTQMVENYLTAVVRSSVPETAEKLTMADRNKALRNFFSVNQQAAMLILLSPHRALLFNALNMPLPPRPTITSGQDVVTHVKALKAHLTGVAQTLGLAPASPDLDRVLVASVKSTLDPPGLGDLQARGLIRVDVDTDSFLSITLLPEPLAGLLSITTPEGVTAALEALEAYLAAMENPQVIEVTFTGARPPIEQEEPPVKVFVLGTGLGTGMIDPDEYLTALNALADQLIPPPAPVEEEEVVEVPPPTPAEVAVDTVQDAVTAGPTGIVFNVAAAIAPRIAPPPSSEIPAPQESFTQRVSRQSDNIRSKIRAMSERREQERERRRRQREARTDTILG